jgi:hypothetical protein
MDDAEAPMTNVSSDVWADALATLERDNGEIDRRMDAVKTARKRRKENLKVFSERGIPTSVLLARYGETLMSEDERHQLFAMEAMSRRALDIWSAKTPEDFNRLLERAVSTQPAKFDSLEKIRGARAFNDGHNSARHGGFTEKDNPNAAGTIEHQQWAKGCRDAIREMTNKATAKKSDAPPSPSAETIADDVEKELAEQQSRPSPRKPGRKQAAPVANDDAPGSGLFSETIP